ncbi:MAG: CBS domain-containing protein [Mariprofundaceae bacterium]
MIEQAKVILIKDVMKNHFDMVDGLSTVSDALHTMQHVETKCLIVDKRDEHDEYGIVVLADIAQLLVQNRSPNRVSIFEVMTRPAVTVPPDMNIRHACTLFSRLGLSRAPVVNANREVIGIVSHTDMVLKGLSKLIE